VPGRVNRDTMNRTEIRLAGSGRQGAVQTQSYGAATRGEPCSEIIISDDPIVYPHLTHPDIVVVMSQEAMAEFGSDMPTGGLLISRAAPPRGSGQRSLVSRV
jgi:Pyruvate/2-oxoacid:ferredoxin oxidoreductase gamma subunit